MSLILPFDGVAPAVHADAFVAANATLVGAVTIDERASVFYGAVIRADLAPVTIGAGSNVQDNVAMHVDRGVALTIGAGVSIGHGAVVHGCTVEDNCLIGMGATVLNGAVIGEGSLVAAGAVVLEGTIVPPGSLVAGVPAKVRRPLTDAERETIADNARRYVQLSHAHAGLSAGDE